jgi:uncharacterized Zn-finger protein
LHDKRRDFTCETCGKMFCTLRQLNHHKRYHNRISVTCNFDGCKKTFVTKYQLSRHMKTHVGKRDQLCHLCDKSYFFFKDLQRHLDSAHKQMTFFCELCDFTHSRKEYLGNHLWSAHQLLKDERVQMLKRVKFIKTPV